MEEEVKAKKQSTREGGKQHEKPASSGGSVQSNEGAPDLFEFDCPVCHQIPQAICAVDHECRIVSANPHMELLSGYTGEEMHGRGLADFIASPPAKEFIELFHKSSRGRSTQFEAQFRNREGAIAWVAISAAPFIDDKGKDIGYLASLTDITDHMRIKDDLALCSDMLDKAPDAIFLRDPEGTYVYANQTAYNERGYSHDEMLTLDLYQVVAPEAQGEVRDRIKSLFNKGKVTFDSVHIKKDGSKFPVEVHLSLLEHEGKKLILSIVHDASQRQKLAEELMRTLKMESVVLLGRGIVSQFNTLLTHITGNLNVLISETEPHTPQCRILEETDKLVVRAREMVRHLASVSTSGAPVKKTCAIGPLIKDTAEYMLTSSNVWANFFIADNLYRVDLDQAQFLQAFSNIVLNASQAMPRGGIINITAQNIHLEENEVRNLPEGNYTEISVADKGHGIKPEDMPLIFDPYFTTRQGNVGLGLSIAYSIIKNHGGTITAESEPSKGSIFHIFLPASTEKTAKEIPSARSKSTGVKILLVDDEAVIRNVGSRILSKLGYDQVEFASEGKEAVKKYQTAMESGRPYDIVIVDLTLPGDMGGKEVVKALHKLDSKANILVSSGYFNDPILTDFHRYGIKGVLAKPYQLEELENMLHEAHGSHQQVAT